MRALALATAVLGVAACGAGDGPASPGTIETVLGTGARDPVVPDDAPREGFSLDLPLDLAVAADGTLYVADWNRFVVREVRDDRVVRLLGNGELGDLVPGDARATPMSHLGDLLLDGAGDLLVASWHGGRIARIDLATHALTLVAGTGRRAYAGDGGAATAADFDLPAGLALRPDGTLLVTDQANQVLRAIDPTTGVIDHFAGHCVVEPDGPCGVAPTACPGTQKAACDVAQCAFPCTPAIDGAPAGDDLATLRLGFELGDQAMPSGKLALGADGTVYVADTLNDRVRAITRDGTVRTVAAVPAPSDLALAADGTLYVASPADDCVRQIVDGVVTPVVGVCGARGFDGDGGPATEALLDRPYGVAFDDARGVLYVADTMNHRIRAVRTRSP